MIPLDRVPAKNDPRLPVLLLQPVKNKLPLHVVA